MTDCPYCKTDLTGNGAYGYLDLIKCPSCELIFRYSKNVGVHGRGRDLEHEHAIHSHDQISGRREILYNHVLEVLTAKKRDKLLDVGTGCGYFLSAAKKAGWRAMGIDPLRNAVQYARKVNQLEVIEGTLDAIESETSFDAVTAINVLDFMDEPWHEIEKAYALLNNDGKLYIRIPNGQMLILVMRLFMKLRLQRHLLKFVVFQKFVFTHRFIKKLLSDIGFKEIQIFSSPICRMPTGCYFCKKSIINSIYARMVIMQRALFAKIYLSTSLDILATK